MKRKTDYGPMTTAYLRGVIRGLKGLPYVPNGQGVEYRRGYMWGRAYEEAEHETKDTR